MIQYLPLVTLHLTDRCNSRCVTCDYWRHGRTDITLASVERFLPSLEGLQTHEVLISGGEPLIHPEWDAIVELLRDNGMRLWLLTSGLALVKHARRVAELCDAVTVSVDGADAGTYEAIRGLDALDKVREGVRAAIAQGARVTLRVTLQRANYRQLGEFVEMAQADGAAGISFLAVDVSNPHAFARTDSALLPLALEPEDLPQFEHAIQRLERDFAGEFQSGFIDESPAKLRRMHQYFAALCGLAPLPPVQCNAPEFSAVIDARGHVHPCFFIPGPGSGPGPETAARSAIDARRSFADVLNSEAMSSLRSDIRAGARPECARCVCSLWRNPENLGVLVPDRRDTFAA
jgi:Fe-coproporphyrin III synthase